MLGRVFRVSWLVSPVVSLCLPSPFVLEGSARFLVVCVSTPLLSVSCWLGVPDFPWIVCRLISFCLPSCWSGCRVSRGLSLHLSSMVSLHVRWVCQELLSPFSPKDPPSYWMCFPGVRWFVSPFVSLCLPSCRTGLPGLRWPVLQSPLVSLHDGCVSACASTLPSSVSRLSPLSSLDGSAVFPVACISACLFLPSLQVGWGCRACCGLCLFCLRLP